MTGWEWMVVLIVAAVLVAILAQIWRDHKETNAAAVREHEVTLARMEQEMFERSLATPMSVVQTRPRVPDLMSRSRVHETLTRITPRMVIRDASPEEVQAFAADVETKLSQEKLS